MFDEGDEREKQRISSMLTSGRVTDLLPQVLDDLSEKGLTTTTGTKLKSKNALFLPQTSVLNIIFTTISYCIIADRSGIRGMADGRTAS